MRSAVTQSKRACGASDWTLGVIQAHVIGQPVGVGGPMRPDEVGQSLGEGWRPKLIVRRYQLPM